MSIEVVGVLTWKERNLNSWFYACFLNLWGLGDTLLFCLHRESSCLCYEASWHTGRWENVLAIGLSGHWNLGKVIWCRRAYHLEWEIMSLLWDQSAHSGGWWVVRECLFFGALRHLDLREVSVGLICVRQDPKASSSPLIHFFLKLCVRFFFSEGKLKVSDS